jgi:hypothetical protein
MFRLFISHLLLFVLRCQKNAWQRRANRLEQRVINAAHASILADIGTLDEVLSDLSARGAKLQSEWNAAGGVALPQRIEQFRCQRTTLKDDLAKYIARRAEVHAAAIVFNECEVQPLSDELGLLQESSIDIIQRTTYMNLWLEGETTAPVLELLLYFVVPISHLEPLAGDLEQEYRTIQIPRLGPRAAQWWYTKHVLKTINCYAVRACKRASVVVTAVDLLRRISHWLGL